MPPIRCRPLDLPELIASEIARAAREQGRTIIGLDREAADRLLAYDWPGNLRELSKVVQTAIALTEGDVVTSAALHLRPPDAGRVPVPAGVERSRPEPTSLALKDVIHAHVRYVLERAHGNKRRAARDLGVARATLERRLREMGIGRSR